MGKSGDQSHEVLQHRDQESEINQGGLLAEDSDFKRAAESLNRDQSGRGNRKEILPRLPRWDQGEQARILREFCAGIGLPSIKFHTLRACFATQLIRNGVPPIQIQKICGWRDLETMQRYIRLAGIEVKGATDSLQVLPAIQVFEKTAAMFTSEHEEAKAG